MGGAGVTRKATSQDESGAAAQATELESQWQMRIFERRSQRLRAKARTKSRRLLNSAFALLVEQGPEFTVQDLVEHAESSYRAFYDYFESKDGLFLAMFEEATNVGLRRQLEAANDGGDDPVARLREFILCRWRLLETGDPVLSRTMVVYHLRLSEVRPDELGAVLQPSYDALLELVMACHASGRLRRDLVPTTCAALLLQTSLSSIQGLALDVRYGGHEVSGEETWAVLARGMFEDVAKRGGRVRKRSS